MDDAEKNKIAMIMLEALRTVASGKGDYGKELMYSWEYRDVAKEALQKIGC